MVDNLLLPCAPEIWTDRRHWLQRSQPARPRSKAWMQRQFLGVSAAVQAPPQNCPVHQPSLPVVSVQQNSQQHSTLQYSSINYLQSQCNFISGSSDITFSQKNFHWEWPTQMLTMDFLHMNQSSWNQWCNFINSEHTFRGVNFVFFFKKSIIVLKNRLLFDYRICAIISSSGWP